MRTINFRSRGVRIGTIWVKDDGEIEAEAAVSGMSWAGYDSVDEAKQHLRDEYRSSRRRA